MTKKAYRYIISVDSSVATPLSLLRFFSLDPDTYGIYFSKAIPHLQRIICYAASDKMSFSDIGPMLEPIEEVELFDGREYGEEVWRELEKMFSKEGDKVAHVLIEGG